MPKFNNEDWKAARIHQQTGVVLGMVPKTTDTFQVGFAHPGENAGGCVLDSTGAAIGLATFRTFRPQQSDAFVSATTLSSLRRLFLNMPNVKAALVPPGKQPASEKLIEDASGLLLSY